MRELTDCEGLVGENDGFVEEDVPIKEFLFLIALLVLLSAYQGSLAAVFSGNRFVRDGL